MMTVAARTGAPMIFMHMRGDPLTMTQENYCSYVDPDFSATSEQEKPLGDVMLEVISKELSIQLDKVNHMYIEVNCITNLKGKQ